MEAGEGGAGELERGVPGAVWGPADRKVSSGGLEGYTHGEE